MNDRKMKKWLPFSSLIEQKDYIRDIKQKKLADKMPLISEDQIATINQILANYQQEIVEIVFYKDSIIQSIKGQISTINAIKKYLVIGSKIIQFSSIIEIKKI